MQLKKEDHEMVIQRIQSLILLVATILLGIVPLFTLGKVDSGEAVTYASMLPLLIVGAVNTVISLITIFKFKHFKTQMRMCYVSLLLTAAQIGVIAIYCVRGDFELSATVPTLLAVAAILTVVAKNFIKRDKKLLDDCNRLR